MFHFLLQSDHLPMMAGGRPPDHKYDGQYGFVDRRGLAETTASYDSGSVAPALTVMDEALSCSLLPVAAVCIPQRKANALGSTFAQPYLLHTARFSHFSARSVTPGHLPHCWNC